MIPWVAGNTLNLAVPLQTKTIISGQEVTAPYTPPAGSTLNVWLVNGRQRRKYDYTLTDNVVHFTDNGTLSPATYAVEIQVIEPSTRHLRTFKLQLAVAAALPVAATPAGSATTPVGSATTPAGSPAGSPSVPPFPEGEILLDAAIFIQGEKGEKGDKGDKGDPGSDADVTAENIERALDGTPLLSITTEQLNAIFD